MPTDQSTLRFGTFQLDPGSRELRTPTTCIRLQEQPFVILQMLLERRGQVVTRDELRERLWPAGTFVDFEHSLNAAVKRLRAALGDDADNPRFIETIPRRGYRFVGDEDEADDGPGASRHRVRLAVLPFSDIGEARTDYFSAGFTDELISALGRRCHQQLGVMSSHSTRLFQDSTASAREIGLALRADYLLEGSVRRNGGRVRITARLVETSSETQLWVDTYEQPLTDWLAAQTEIARHIADSLAVELRPETRASSVAARDPQAYEAYLQGRAHWQRVADTGAHEALQYFTAAAEREPSFAAAHAGIAIVQVMRAVYYHERPLAALEKARAAADRALQIDAGVAEAHVAAADVARMLLYDHGAARSAWSRAIALNPSMESARAGHARLLASIGRFAHAIREADTARELDPRCLTTNTLAAWARYVVGDYDAAIALCRHAVEIYDRHLGARQMLGLALLAEGSRNEALRVLETTVDPGDPHPGAVAALAYGRAAIGDGAAARALIGTLDRLAEHRYVSPYSRALVWSALDEPGCAFAELHRALDDRDPALLNVAVEPRLAPLRSDRRYAPLIARLGLDRFHGHTGATG